MSVNAPNTAQTAPRTSIKGTLIEQGKSALAGGITGAAAGALVGTLKPVTKNQIAEQIADHFVKTDGKGLMEEYVKVLSQEKPDEKAVKNIVEKCQEFATQSMDKAQKAVKQFFAKPKAERITEADDLVKVAKKCAKKAQKSKYIGTAIFAGVLIALVGNLFKPTARVAQNNQMASNEANLTKVATHQG